MHTTHVPSPLHACKLLIVEAMQAIGANVLQVSLTPRATYNGANYDIAYDAEMTWVRQGHDGQPSYGTHAGSVRIKLWASEDGPQWDASIYWGHYDFATENEAREDRPLASGAVHFSCDPGSIIDLGAM